MKVELKNNYTPMMQQYLKIKEDYVDALVFFRLGDFYEMFFDDAIIASKVLEIALTKRDAGQKIPMCGVPYHSVKPYIQKLIENGYKIAIAEQVTETGKGLVIREVKRVITPGTVFEDEILDKNSNNFIASIIYTETGYLLTYADISTGEAFLTDKLTKEELLDQIKMLKIKEIIINNDFDQTVIDELKTNNVYLTIYKNTQGNDLKWSENLHSSQKIGARHLLNYLNETQMQHLSHLQKIVFVEHKKYMRVDYRVKKHLEIIESNTNNPQTTLLQTIDNTKTAMGTRKLKNQLNHPLLDINLLNERFTLIEAFLPLKNRGNLVEELSYIYDINRIVGKVAFNSANARDLYQLKATLKHIKPLKEALYKYENPLITKLADSINEHDDLYQLLDSTIIDNPPITIKEGGIIKPLYNDKLDELHNINQNSKKWLANFEEDERNKTGIKTLKIGYNRVFGYYIEISKAASLQLPDDYGYIRRQTLTNSERYISPVLKEKEDLILHAKDKAINLEYELFVAIREDVNKYSHSLQILSNVIADIDVYLSHAITALTNNYIKPNIINSRQLEIKKGRHPVVEKFNKFIANDVKMNESEIDIITGPNMSGKSTYMRMVALIIYMAQIGSFVPASLANIPIYDAIFTRIGSSDDLSGGKSTFMVEMVESNEALELATNNSLIIFDEIGRGTATYDGMALAQGIIEYIYHNIKAQMLFSTHYHELTKLAESYDKIINLHVKAKEENNKMIFLHQISEGPSDRSYGIQVASLANLPKELIARSHEILRQLESQKIMDVNLFNYDETKKESVISTDEQALIDNATKIVSEITDINLDRVTPIEALIILKRLQDVIKK